MKRLTLFGNIFAFILIVSNPYVLDAQEKYYYIKPRALDVGVYDYSKVKKNPYKVYYDEEADEKFNELLMSDERLRSNNAFGEYIEREDGNVEYFREQWAYEYCPELNYVMIAGGHGYVSAYDLQTLEEIYVNPSSYVYSPSGKYRFGTFEFDGMKYYIEVKESEKYTRHYLFEGNRGSITGAYWVDDETMYYLREIRMSDDEKYWIGYSTKFYEANR